MSSNPDDSTNPNPPEGSIPGGVRKSGGSMSNLLWMLIVLLTGAAVGIVSFLLVAPHIVISGGHTPFPFPILVSSRVMSALTTLIAGHIILSTISIALLASLLFVYGRTFRQTRANFALGILIVLLALLFEATLDYPILQLSLGPVSSTEFSSPLPTIADIFTVVAYTVFLYLSLE